MPEMRFRIRWPSGDEESCYSPSLVIKDFFEPGARYALDDFITRCRQALQIASDRVKASYGMPCSLALSQLQRIEARGRSFAETPDPHVLILAFDE